MSNPRRARRRTGRATAVAAALMGLVVAACSSGGSGQGASPIVIGVLAGLTGDSAIFGVQFAKGARMAADEINQKGGVNGRQVQLEVVDNQTSPTVGVSATTKFANVDHVGAIVCSCYSVIYFPIAAALASNDQMIIFNSAAGGLDVRKNHNTISTLELTDTLGAQLADWVYKTKGIKSAALVSDSDPYGITYHDAVKAEWAKLGGTLALDVVGQPGLSDYAPELRRVVAAQSSYDIVFSSISGTEAQLQFRQWTELGGTKPWYILYPTATDFSKLPEASGKIFGIEDSVVDPAFGDRFQKKYGEKASYLGGALGYDDVWLAAYGVGNAKQQTTQAKLDAVRAAAANHVGASGKLEFDSDFSRTNIDVAKYQWLNGQNVPVQ